MLEPTQEPERARDVGACGVVTGKRLGVMRFANCNAGTDRAALGGLAHSVDTPILRIAFLLKIAVRNQLAQVISRVGAESGQPLLGGPG